MQSQVSYKEYLKLSQKQKGQIFDIPQGKPSSIQFAKNHKYPEEMFIKLTSKQEGKEIKLATYRYPTENPKAVAILQHHLNTHSNTVAHIANQLSKQHILTVAFDHRGHGKSQGQKFYFDDAETILNDYRTFIKEIGKMYTNLPIFLLGIGFSGLMSLILCQQKDLNIKGFVLLSTPLKPPVNNPVAKAISGFALKLMPNRAGLFVPDYKKITRNPKVSELLENDPTINHEKICANTMVQVMKFMEQIEQQKWGKMKLPPIAIVHGQNDKQAEISNMIKFYETITTQDKIFWFYPQMWNACFFEPQWQQIINKISLWIHKHSQS